jgi:iron complex outermembrane receptor protein
LRPVSNLSITPGVKYVHFKRGVNALVNADTNRSPANTSATWTKTLPFATINWQPEQLVVLWPVCAGHVCARPVELLHAFV